MAALLVTLPVACTSDPAAAPSSSPTPLKPAVATASPTPTTAAKGSSSPTPLKPAVATASPRPTTVDKGSSSQTTYTAADRSFSVTLPAKPTTGPKKRLAAGIVATLTTAESGDVGASVTHLVIDPGVAFDGLQGMRGAVDQVAKGSGGTVSDYRSVPFGRYPGAVATVEGIRGVVKLLRMRLVYTGKAVIVITSTDSVYDRTVGSLRIS